MVVALLAVCAAGGVAQAQAPDPPTGVSAQDVAGDQGGSIQVSWTLSPDDGAGDNDVTEYRIYRSTSSGAPGTFILAVANGTATATDGTAAAGQNYYYMVRAYDGAEESADSNQVGPVQAVDNIAPAAPTAVDAIDKPNDNGKSVLVTWTPSTDEPGGGGSDDVTRYYIYRSVVAGATGSSIGFVAAGIDLYEDKDTGLVNGTTYYYRVRAYDGTNESANSNQASAAPIDNTAPAAPSAPGAVDHPNDPGGAIDVTWAKSADDGTGARDVVQYRIYRTETPGVYADPAVTTAAAGATSAVDLSATIGTAFYYTVRAYDGTQESSASTEVGPVTSRDNRPVQTPGNVVVSDVDPDQGTALTATWDHSLDAPGQGGRDIVTTYRIYRRLVGGSFQNIGSVAVAGPLTFTDTTCSKLSSYEYTVRAYTGTEESANANIYGPVSPIDNIAPQPVTNVVVVDTPSDNGSSITVTWTRSPDDDGAGFDDVTQYRVYRSPVSGGFGPPAVGTASAGSSLFIDTTVSDGVTYFYMVRAYDGTRESSDSNAASATPEDNLKPRRPVNLRAVDTPSDAGGQIDLTWTLSPDDAIDVVEYRVRRGTTSTDMPDIVAVLSPGTDTCTDDTAANQANYYYVVEAYDGTYVSDPSNTAGPAWAVDNRDLLPPTAVQGADHPNDQGGRLDLTWDLSGDDGMGRDTVTQYHIYRKVAGSTDAPTRIGTVAAGTAAVSDYSARVGVSYEYTVRAYNSVIESPDSNAVGPIGSADNIVPGAVTDVSAIDQNPNHPSSIVVAFAPSPDDNPTGDVLEYRIYRSVVSGGYGSPLGTVPAGQTAYTDDSALPEVKYFYVVRAYDGSNESPDSDEVGPVQSTDVVAPAPATQVRAEDVSNDNGGVARISWTLSADDGGGVDDVVRYDILRTTDPQASAAVIGTVGAGESSYEDVTVEDGLDYYYVVRVTDGLNSADSEIAGPARPTDDLAPAAPTVLSADTIPGGQGTLVTLEWQLSADDGAAAGDVREYQIYRALAPTEFGAPLATVPAGTGSYVDADAYPSVDYYYSVRAFDGRFRSDPSPVAGPVHSVDTTPPDPPLDLQATAEPSRVSLVWDASISTDVAGYYIYRSRGTITNFQRLNGVPLNALFYMDEAVTENVKYYYRISAIDRATPFNESAFTPAVEATPLDSTPPLAPQGLQAVASNRRVDLTWLPNEEDDLEGYRVYRSTGEQGPFARLTTELLTDPAYSDAGVVNGTTYYYHVTALDDAGIPNESNPSETVPATPERVFRFSLAPGVYMVSFPVTNVPQDPRQGFTVDNDQWRLVRWWRPDRPDAAYRYADPSYADPSATLVPSDASATGANPTVPYAPAGLGYWLVIRDNTELVIGGDGVPASGGYRVHLYPGWNQVGNPWETAILWSQMTTEPADAIEKVGWVWDMARGYVPLFSASADNLLDRIQPLTSCWVKASQECDLLLPPGATSGTSAAATSARGLFEGVSWKVRLAAHAGSRSDESNWVGAAPGHQGLPTAVEEPPQPGGYVNLFVRGEGGRHLAVDLRDAEAEEIRWDVWVETDIPDASVRITAGDLRELPREWTLLLRDTEADRQVFLRTVPSYEFRSGPTGASRHFELLARRGNAGALRIAGLQASLVRGGDVDLSFVLTRAADTTVEILNAAGRRVSLVESGRTRAPGAQGVYWNRQSDTRARVPSGMYLVKITARAESGEQTEAIRTVQVGP